MNLKAGMRVRGIGITGDLLYIGEVITVDDDNLSAWIQLNSPDGSKRWCWRKEDNSWGADCLYGNLVISNASLPWEP